MAEVAFAGYVAALFGAMLTLGAVVMMLLATHDFHVDDEQDRRIRRKLEAARRRNRGQRPNPSRRPSR
jgi:hypothetical protein